MGKGSVNPADRERKKLKQQEKRRNKEEKAKVKEVWSQGDPEAILNEIKGLHHFSFHFIHYSKNPPPQEIARRESQGYVDHAQSKRKRMLLEMHKKVTQKVLHDEKKGVAPPQKKVERKEGGDGLTAPSWNAVPGTDYYNSVQRLKAQQMEEERQKGFDELLKVQLAASAEGSNIKKRDAAEVMEGALEETRALEALKGQKMLATKKTKIVETDIFGNVINKPETVSAPVSVAASAPVSAPVSAAPASVPAVKKSAALNLLGGYGTAADVEVDPFDSFMAEINKL